MRRSRYRLTLLTFLLIAGVWFAWNIIGPGEERRDTQAPQPATMTGKSLPDTPLPVSTNHPEDVAGSGAGTGEDAMATRLPGEVCISPGWQFGCFTEAAGAGPFLDNAVSGLRQQDYYSALQLWHLLNFCQNVPRGADDLVSVVLRVRMLEKGVVEAFPDHPLTDSDFSRFGVNRYPGSEGYPRTLYYCQPVFTLLDAGFLTEVAAMAHAGNEAAQLLYALWEPSPLEPFSARLGWQLQAQDFSEMSLRNGTPMGFIAYVYSYHEGIFTPIDYANAFAYLEAAKRCSVDSDLFPRYLISWSEDGVSQYGSYAWDESVRDRWAEQLSSACR